MLDLIRQRYFFQEMNLIYEISFFIKNDQPYKSVFYVCKVLAFLFYSCGDECWYNVDEWFLFEDKSVFFVIVLKKFKFETVIILS